MDPQAALEALAGCRRPFLVGVRHHSPVLAAAVPALLDAAEPQMVLVELPQELQGWLAWLGHPGTVAPVALALAARDGSRLGFYPFADFSPELAAIRWAAARGVPVEAVDLPATARDGPAGDGAAAAGGGAVTPGLLRRFGVPDAEELWDRVVEAPACGADPERVRRAGLALGWAMRADAVSGPGVDRADLAREAWMRRRIAAAAGRNDRLAAVVGAFHAAALLPEPDPAFWSDPGLDLDPAPGDEAVTSLVPYAFDLLDSRSGYPAGIRDPAWQQALWEARGEPQRVERAAAEMAVRVCAELRGERQVAGVPDGREAFRLAGDLARLRGLPAPGRRELVEGIQTALGQGEPLGRGRALARAAQAVLVGNRLGALPPGAPRTGLHAQVEALVAELGLPGPAAGVEAVELRLDPARSPLDRRRHVTLRRLAAAGVCYAQEREVAGLGGAQALGRRWTARWQPATAATLELAALAGATLEQAAEGTLRRRAAGLAAADELVPLAALELVEQAAECGLAALTTELVSGLGETLLPSAGLAELVAAHRLLERIAAGHVPGLPTERGHPSDPPPYRPPSDPSLDDLVASAVAAVEGLAGSDDLADAVALAELVRLVERGRAEPPAAGEGRLAWTLARLTADGGPLMQGAAGAALVLLGHTQPARLGARLASWVDFGADPGRDLARRLQGVLVMAAPLLEVCAELLDPLARRVETLPDAAFLQRLPALRDGFEVLSPAVRQRFLDTVADRFGLHDPAELGRRLTVEHAPAALAGWAAADAAGRAAVLAQDPDVLDKRPGRLADGDALPAAVGGGQLGIAPPATPAPAGHPPDPRDPPTEPDPPDPPPAAATSTTSAAPAIAPLDRWRLVLGRERECLGPTPSRAAVALDELYGHGRGEGSAAAGLGQGDGGRRGGQEAPFPTPREWADELQALFGGRVRDEVLARAAARGRADALLAVDPDAVVASVDLLEQVLSLHGALPEARLGQLRRLVDRIVAELVRELARRLRPALVGLAVPRPTRRPAGPLDLDRTVRANLHTARRGPDGGAVLVPERPRFRTRARRAADWHVTIVVDVSGSMEASTIYSAVIAAILNGLPALSVRFVTFSTEVVDLSGRVDDPLGLLLEVAVGGGTDIGAGLGYARQRLTVPRRTIVALVTDFEEGVSVGKLLAEVRALAESGAQLLGLAALDDRGQPDFNRAIAAQVAAAGMPVAALSPLELARWIGERVRGG
jgi:Mg-chelatase subunit ChlD